MSWEEFVRVVKHRVRYLMFPPEMEHDEETTAHAAMLDELGDLFRTHGN